jgi:PAS domain S-box-containing protein
MLVLYLQLMYMQHKLQRAHDRAGIPAGKPLFATNQRNDLSWRRSPVVAPRHQQITLNSRDIQRFVNGLPGMILVLQADAAFTIVCASPQYFKATFTDASMLGRPLFDVFPDNPGDAGATGVANLTASLERVLATRAPDRVTAQRYDVRTPHSGDAFAAKYWHAVNSPVLDDDGEVEYIVQTVEEAAAPAGRDAANGPDGGTEGFFTLDRQRRMYEAALNSTPDFFYVFDLEHRALYANEALLKTWGVDDVRGKKWMDLGYEQWHADMHDREIDQVINTRAPIRGEIPFTGTGGRRYYDYIFAPVFGGGGEVVAVAGTTRDITERQAAEQSIREQAARLAELDRSKDEFLATLSHELRNPLAPLRNAIALLRRSEGEGGNSAPVHAMMGRQVDHLVRLVDDLLEMSRISRGALSLRKERVEVAAIVRNAVETSEPLLRAAGHEWTVELPDTPLWVEGDPVRLAQVLANLLNNAANYTESGGRIRVSARAVGDQALVSVSDNGMGIAEQDLPRMFEMFSRGNRMSGRSQAGLGIGLALSLRLAQMHGGTLRAHSDGPGRGSEFTVALPLTAPQETLDPRPAAGATSLARSRVLVVDDNHDAADSLAMILGLLGAEVQVARSGVQALEVFDGYAPSVVLMDIGMPGMNGYEVARALRGRPAGQRTTLVALTGWGQAEDRRLAREAGFDHHLVKPAELDSLQNLLASIESGA